MPEARELLIALCLRLPVKQRAGSDDSYPRKTLTSMIGWIFPTAIAVVDVELIFMDGSPN